MPPAWRTTWFVKLENVRKGCVLLFSTENSTFTSGDQHNAPVKMLSLFRKSTVFSWYQLMCHLRCPSIPSSTVAEVNKRDSCDAGSGGLTCDSVGLSNFVRESIISDLESLREKKKKNAIMCWDRWMPQKKQDGIKALKLNLRGNSNCHCALRISFSKRRRWIRNDNVLRYAGHG